MNSLAPATRAAWLALFVSLAVAGCATSPGAGAPSPRKERGEGAASPVSHRAANAPKHADVGSVAERLFFGRAIPGGGEVSDAQWNTFVAEVITPRFPDGFTLWRAQGHWRGDDGVAVQEQTMVLEVLHHGDAAAERAVAEIADMYCRRFNQDAVLRVRTAVESQLHRR